MRSTLTSRGALVSPTGCYSIVHNNKPSEVVLTQKVIEESKQKLDQLQSEDFNSFISQTDKNTLSKVSLSSNLKEQNRQVNQSSLQTKKSHKILNFSMKNNCTQRHNAARANSQIGSCVKINLSSTRYASSFCQDQDQEQKQLQGKLEVQSSRISDILKNVEISTQLLQETKYKQIEIQKQLSSNVLQQNSPHTNTKGKNSAQASQQQIKKTTNPCTIKSPLLLQQSSIYQHQFLDNKCSKMNKSCASQQVVQLFQFEQSKNLDLASPIECQSLFNNSISLGRDCLVQNYSFQQSNFFESFIIAPHNLGPLKCKLSKTIGLMPSRSQQDISLRTIDKDMLQDQELLRIVEGGEDDYQRKLGITQINSIQQQVVDSNYLFDSNSVLAIFKSRRNDIIQQRNIIKQKSNNRNLLNHYPISMFQMKDASRKRDQEIHKKSSFCSSNNSSILQSCIKDGPVVPLGLPAMSQKQMLTIHQPSTKYRRIPNPDKQQNHQHEQKKRIKTSKKFFTDQGESDLPGRPSDSDNTSQCSSVFSQFYEHHPQLSQKIMERTFQQHKQKHQHALATHRLRPPKPSN